MIWIKIWLRWAFKRAAYQILMGRYRDRQQPLEGRFTHRQVDELLAQIWRKLDALLPQAELSQYRKLGNRQNLYLAVATRAAYQVFRNAGIDEAYATELISDVAWKVYLSWIPPLRFLARLVRRDPQKQMDFILGALLRYPFSEPGYQRKVWAKADGMCTYWYRCAPHEYFKQHGDAEEMRFFNQTWCTFDWAVAQEMVPGGWYERPHTLSDGDDVCDMKWHANPEEILPKA